MTPPKTTMRHFKNFGQACASAILVALLSSTVHADTNRQDFMAALQKWRAAGIHDYNFSLDQSCLCPGVQPVSVTVQNDAVQSARNLKDGTPVAASVLGRLPSLDGILQKIEAAYAQPAEHITLTLNPEYGYPERVFIDYSTMIADEELSYQISNFTH